MLASCYRNSLRLAVENEVRTIAFPAISTGVYGYPLADATQVAVDTVAASLEGMPSIDMVTFCCFGADALAAYELRCLP